MSNDGNGTRSGDWAYTYQVQNLESRLAAAEQERDSACVALNALAVHNNQIKDELAKFRVENEQMKSALENASEVIHDEFCSVGEHHPFCIHARDALDKGGGK